VVNNIWTTLRTIFTNIFTTVSQKVTDIKTAVTNAFNTIKTTVTTAVENAKTAVVDKFESMKTEVGNKIEAIKTTVSEKFEAVKTKIGEKMDAAWEKVTEIVEKIKGAFNFEWKLPDLKVPHITVTGGEPPYGIGGKGSLPHFSVTWNKRGYQDGLLFTQPTVLPTAAGLQGFGDGNGAELVIGLNRLKQIIGDAAGGNNIAVNVYAAPGMSETQIADAVAMRLDRWLGSRIS
jgi:hypothetical protein